MRIHAIEKERSDFPRYSYLVCLECGQEFGQCDERVLKVDFIENARFNYPQQYGALFCSEECIAKFYDVSVTEVEVD